jgi:ATP-dependent DNA ligase
MINIDYQKFNMSDREEILYKVNARGKLSQWRTWTEGSVCLCEHGQVGGKLIVNRKECTPKNVGRSNETTAEEQAIIESKAMWHKKRYRNGYAPLHEVESGTSNKFSPMLAADYDGQRVKNWPVYCQPKLDGIRGIYRDGKLVSRRDLNFPHFAAIKAELKLVVQNIRDELDTDPILDGELFSRDITFSDITSIVRTTKNIHPREDEIQYWIYDIVLDLPYDERYSILQRHINGEHLRLIDSYKAYDNREVQEFYGDFVDEGYEGAIIRELGPGYIQSRTRALSKLKATDTAEYEIVGATHSIGGQEDGAVVWIVRGKRNNRDDYVEFRVRPKGTIEERRQLYEYRDQYIGKMLTVSFQGYTDISDTCGGGIPRMPVGIAIRDYE